MRLLTRAAPAAVVAALAVALVAVAAPSQPADAAPACTITGNNAGNELNGTPGRDVICGLGGDDTLRGFGGRDVIRGGGGDDILYGGPGADSVFGDHGEDIVHTRTVSPATTWPTAARRPATPAGPIPRTSGCAARRAAAPRWKRKARSGGPSAQEE